MIKSIARATLLILTFSSLSVPNIAGATAPAAPQNVVVSNASPANTQPTEARIIVTWSQVPQAIGYTVSYTGEGVSNTVSVAPGSVTSVV